MVTLYKNNKTITLKGGVNRFDKNKYDIVKTGCNYLAIEKNINNFKKKTIINKQRGKK